MRRRRSPLVFDLNGAPVSARGASRAASRGLGSPYDSGILSRQVPNGTPLPAGLDNVTVSVDFPAPGVTTWYYPSALAYLLANIGAAADTVTDTAGTVADRVGAVLGDVPGVLRIVLAIAGVVLVLRVMGSVRR